MNLRLTPKKMVSVLGLAAIVLVILHIFACLPMLFMGRSYPLGYLSLDGESNLPSMFSTALLWFDALLAGCIAWAQGDKQRNRLYWMGLSVAFLCAGMDEATIFHERISEGIKHFVDTSGHLYFAWVIPYSVLVLVFSMVFLRFFLRLPADTRRHVALAWLLYITGAIGLEMLSGKWMSSHSKDAVFYLFVTIEETLEMLGSIIFIYAFSNYIARYLPDFCLRITED